MRICGDFDRTGADLIGLPFRRFLGAVYSWYVREASSEGIEKFDQWLHMPPPGAKKDALAARPGWSKEEQASEFMAMLGKRNSGSG